jgi:Glycosyl transferase family 2
MSPIRQNRLRPTIGRGLRNLLNSEIAAPFVARFASGFRLKRISAMMRVKNEEAFLRMAAESILPLVDEVVIVDNDSSDATPQIARSLSELHADKIRVFSYPYAVARVGSENNELASGHDGRNSPRLLANYYNWCMQRCRMNYILKWDGDMIATPSLARHIAQFKKSHDLIMWVFGANLHPDHQHLVGAPTDTQREIERAMPLPGAVKSHLSPYTDGHPLLFPKFLATHRPDFWWCEALDTPWVRWSVRNVGVEGCGFLHLKYCRPDPYEHWSSDFAALMKRGVVPGPDVPLELRPLVGSLQAGAAGAIQ